MESNVPPPTYAQTAQAASYGAQYYEQKKATPAIALNIPYLKTIPGILKIAEMVLGLILIICISSSKYLIEFGGGGFADFVAVTSLIIACVLFVFYLFNIMFKLPGPLPLVLLIYYAITTLLYVIAFIICAAGSWAGAGAVAGAIFGAINSAVYGFDTFLYFNAWRENTLWLKWMPEPPVEDPSPQSPVEAPPQY